MLRKHIAALSAFASVGAIGFVIEALLLQALTQLAGWTPWQARIPSFVVAVTVTWALNRTTTFNARRKHDRLTEAFLYFATQATGAMINLGIFGLVLHFFPQLRAIPVIALAAGAVGGLAFNYAVASTLIYPRKIAADPR